MKRFQKREQKVFVNCGQVNRWQRSLAAAARVLLFSNTIRHHNLLPVLIGSMDSAQQKALNALEPYVLLSKSATSPRSAVDLITQATSSPNTYVFAELLETPNIQALHNASPEHAIYLTLLEIFSWGTWSDYQGLCIFTSSLSCSKAPAPPPLPKLTKNK